MLEHIRQDDGVFRSSTKAPLDAREVEILWSDEANENPLNFLENRSLCITITFGCSQRNICNMQLQAMVNVILLMNA